MLSPSEIETLPQCHGRFVGVRQRRYYSHGAFRRDFGRLYRAACAVEESLLTGSPIEIYAQTCEAPRESAVFKFWYKVFFFTQHGVWKTDTGGESCPTRAEARDIIRGQGLQAVSMEALMQNWFRCKVWETSRPLAARLLRTWCALRGLDAEQGIGRCPWGESEDACSRTKETV